MQPHRASKAGKLLAVAGSFLLLTIACFFLRTPGSTPLSAFQINEEEEEHFRLFKLKYAKEYISEEVHSLRFQVFRTNLAYIRLHNSQPRSFSLGLTKFADLSNEEFTEMYTSQSQRGKGERRENRLKAEDLPEEVNWVAKGAVTPIQNQGFCGSCWAFASTGAVESAYFLKTGQLTPLSQQELLDCSKQFGTSGCDGGEMVDAYSYISARGGLETATAYPYEEKDRKCRLNDSQKLGAISGFESVEKGSEAQLKIAVAKQPVSVGVQANEKVWQMYESGVMDSDCGQHLNHAVLVVGYGREHDMDYWLVKNTWGDDWGIEGYVKILRDDSSTNGGLCGIALDASYPTF